MTHFALPLVATGWKNTLVNDSEGNTILLMPNGHKGVEAVQEATALFAAAPDLLEALCRAQGLLVELRAHELTDADDVAIMAAIEAAIAKAIGPVVQAVQS